MYGCKVCIQLHSFVCGCLVFPVNQPFSKKTILSSLDWASLLKIDECKSEALFVDSPFYSIDLYACPYASSRMP